MSLEPLTDYSNLKLNVKKYFLNINQMILLPLIRPATVCGYSQERLDLVVNILTI